MAMQVARVADPHADGDDTATRPSAATTAPPAGGRENAAGSHECPNCAGVGCLPQDALGVPCSRCGGSGRVVCCEACGVLITPLGPYTQQLCGTCRTRVREACTAKTRGRAVLGGVFNHRGRLVAVRYRLASGDEVQIPFGR